MYRRVIANLVWDTPSRRDSFKSDLEAKLSNMPTFDQGHSHEVGISGEPVSSIDVRAESATDADELYNWIQSKMDNVPVMSGEVNIHDCRNDEGSSTQCSIESSYQA